MLNGECKLPAAEKEELFLLCDRAFRQVVRVLEPDLIIGVGEFAGDRGWRQQAEIQLEKLGVRLPLHNQKSGLS